MATNPMQRRARNSFLAGMLVTLIVAVLIVAALFYHIMNLNKDITNLKKVQTTAYVLSYDIESGTPVTSDMFTPKTVITSVPAEDIVTPTFFENYDDSGNIIPKDYVAKINLPAGTIVTENMLIEKGNEVTNDMRMVEYNMISLPTELVTGNFVDIRLVMPGGQNYIVVSKKYVEKANLDTIWMKLSEEEILTLGNAIVESYIIEGSKLEATIYVEAGTQEAATPTYAVSEAVLKEINKNPNIRDEAKSLLYERYNNQVQVEQRKDIIDNELNQYSDNRNSSVSTKMQEEITKLKASREEYLTELGEI